MIDNNKVAFIYCSNNETELKRSLTVLLDIVEIPEGFTIETIVIRDAVSMTSGYQRGMEQSNAKYKVYLHQDVLLQHKDFLKDTIGIFTINPRVGMIGMIGTSKLLPHAVWWDGNKIGSVIDNTRGPLTKLEFQQALPGRSLLAKVVDGLLMMTQYDIPWDVENFTGWHFYDVSQCTRFTRGGYAIAVPYQATPWCIHDNNHNPKTGADTYERDRLIFLEKYRP